MCKASRLLCLWLVLGIRPALAADEAFEATPYFKTSDQLKQYLLENSDVDATVDDLTVDLLPSGNWRLELMEVHREVDGDGNRSADAIAVLMDYSSEGNMIVGGTGRMAGVAFCKGHTYPLKPRPTCYGMPKVSQEQRDRAAVIARYFVQRNAQDVLSDAHSTALAEFKKGSKGEAAKTSLPFVKSAPWKVLPIAADNVESYNDLGFFLEEGGKYKEAVQVLEEVTRAVPDRTAAYLNLGDAYVGLSDTPRAKAAYKQYKKLMEQSGNGAKIPKRIQKYL